ncbi:hypothetical protein [Methylohalobius crimeensis]|nr:hypothetical protein [Methylohalobius crimeensis]
MTITIKRDFPGRIQTFLKLLDAAFTMLVFGEVVLVFQGSKSSDEV